MFVCGDLTVVGARRWMASKEPVAIVQEKCGSGLGVGQHCEDNE